MTADVFGALAGMTPSCGGRWLYALCVAGDCQSVLCVDWPDMTRAGIVSEVLGYTL